MWPGTVKVMCFPDYNYSQRIKVVWKRSGVGRLQICDIGVDISKKYTISKLRNTHADFWHITFPCMKEGYFKVLLDPKGLKETHCLNNLFISKGKKKPVFWNLNMTSFTLVKNIAILMSFNSVQIHRSYYLPNNYCIFLSLVSVSY